MKRKGKMKSDIKVDGSGNMKMWKEWEMLKKVYMIKKNEYDFIRKFLFICI